LSVAACVAILLGGGFLLVKMGGDTQNLAYTQPTDNPGTLPPTDVHIETMEGDWMPTATAYDDILRLYKAALAENWTIEQYRQAGISSAVVEKSARGSLGWSLLDINNDGNEELIISDGETLYDLYAISGEDALENLARSEGEIYCKLYDGGILIRQTILETETSWTVFSLDRDTRNVRSLVVFRDQTYYAGTSELDLKPISKDSVPDLIMNYSAAPLELTPFQVIPEDLYADKNVNPEYIPCLQLYETALREDWNPGICAENGISLMVGYYGELFDELGYALIDLDGNGVNELIITDGNYIYDLYTIVDDEEYGPLRLLTGSERITYNLMEYNRIFCWGSSGAAVSHYTFSVLEGRELRIQEGYLYDADTDPENPWFFYDGEHLPQPCGDFDAEAVVNGGYMYVEIPFTSFE